PPEREPTPKSETAHWIVQNAAYRPPLATNNELLPPAGSLHRPRHHRARMRSPPTMQAPAWIRAEQPLRQHSSACWQTVVLQWPQWSAQCCWAHPIWRHRLLLAIVERYASVLQRPHWTAPLRAIPLPWLSPGLTNAPSRRSPRFCEPLQAGERIVQRDTLHETASSIDGRESAMWPAVLPNPNQLRDNPPWQPRNFPAHRLPAEWHEDRSALAGRSPSEV